jgi:ABC-type dipeptide/oligopeptide/nickel transport system permease component
VVRGTAAGALALTVVLAPTLVWTVFNGLRGTGGQPLPSVAGDYLVQKYWHFDLGRSSAYSDTTMALWMPCVLVGLPLAAAVLRITSATLREISGEEFLRTARANGLTELRVMRRHALPLAVAPVAALTGANMAMLVTNVALVESAFNIPGIYREIRSVYSFADLPMIQAMVIETTVLIVVANTLADLIQARMDPQLR